MTKLYVLAEQDIEQQVRTIRCRTCGTPPHYRCIYPLQADGTVAGPMAAYSHTGRYLDAVDAGLVRRPPWMT